jgi:parallel beta-helix repeat protein
MSKKLILVMILIVILISTLTLLLTFNLLKREPRTFVVPDSYLTIQEAINKANEYDTIYVKAGIYYENVLIKKSLSLIGENKTATTIDGNKTSNYVIRILANNVRVEGFTVRNSGYNGISLYYSSKCIIMDNNMSWNFDNGVDVTGGGNNKVIQNIIDNNGLVGSGAGVSLTYSENNMIANNIISNTKGPGPGVELSDTSNNTIARNQLTRNSAGILFSRDALRTKVIYNVIINNRVAFGGPSSNGTFIGNNFINNTVPIGFYEPPNMWDDGYPSGGNYWSDYTGKDLFSGPYQNETGSDGIGDTPRYADNYPLMGMFSDFNATSEHRVQTISNSTISDFQFNSTAIRFNVSGENGTTGFCRVRIPTALLNDTYKVFVNSTRVPHTLLRCSSSTYNYLYFAYNHSTQEVVIVPEFP